MLLGARLQGYSFSAHTPQDPPGHLSWGQWQARTEGGLREATKEDLV